MQAQETLKNGNGKAPSMAKGVRDLAADIVCLAELQGQLFLTDMREGRSRVVRSLAMLGAVPVLALAALPVLLLGGSTWLAEQFAWNAAVVQVALSALLLVVAGLFGWRGWVAFGSAFETLTRSRDEFSENIRWLKSALKSRDTESDNELPWTTR
jgi:uncharacterized membrane protein YqjE